MEASTVEPTSVLEELFDTYGGACWHGSVEAGAGPDEEAGLREAVVDGARWILIEENVAGGFWLTAHRSADGAGRYHLDQEYAGDWSIVELVHLDTDECYDPVVSVTWTRRD